MNHTELKRIFSGFWTSLFWAWKYRGLVLDLIGEVERLKVENSVPRDEEIQPEILKMLLDQIDKAKVESAKDKRIIANLWKFIKESRRLNQEAEPGTLRKILLESQRG